jgi:glutamate-5-semialdehyde dehydrogenase
VIRADDATIAQMPSGETFERVRFASLPDDGLGYEYEWENDPEFAVVLVDSIDEAVSLCNEYSPHFVVSVLTDDTELIEKVYSSADAPFVGNGFTRWVDGQYALGQPELGLSNWQGGRLLGRGGVLSGSSVHTLRLLAQFSDPMIRR